MPRDRVLTSKLALADNTKVSLLDKVALEMTIAVMDPSKSLGALIAAIGTEGLMGHAMGLEVEWSRERAAATGKRADKAVDGGLVDIFWLVGTIVPIVAILDVLNSSGFVGKRFRTCFGERKGL